MRLKIVGAGALGLLYAAKIASVFEDVILITKSEAQALQCAKQGILLHEAQKTYNVHLVCTSFRQDVHPFHSDEDWVLLMVKQTHMDKELLEYVSQQMKQGCNILCFQNGVGHLEKLESAGIKPESLFIAVTTEAARKKGMREVVHTGFGNTAVGAYSQTDPSGNGKLFALAKVFATAGLETNVTNQIVSFVWRKLMINAIINPLTAILQVENGQLLSSREWIDWMQILLREGLEVASSMNIKLPDNMWEQVVDVCKKTSKNRSSMLEDLTAKRKTEIDWINGSIVRHAYRFGIAVPYHEAVCSTIKKLEDSNHVAM